MKPTLLYTAAITSLLLSSCATKLTTAQKQSLSTVAISPVKVEAKAYQEPNGGDQAGSNQAATIGVTSGTGALGGIVGSLVGEAISATQNTMFKGKSEQYFEAAKTNTPEMSGPVTAELTKAIKTNSFFGSRLRNTSPNTFTSKVISYGLVRSGKTTDGNILLAAQVVTDIHLKDASGKNLVGGRYIGLGHNHPITTYAKSASESRKSYELATKTAVQQFTSALSKKTGQ